MALLPKPVLAAPGKMRQAPTEPDMSSPSDALIVVPVRDTVLLPGTVFPIAVSRERSIAAAQQAAREERQIGVLMQRDTAVEDPLAIDMHRIGTVANILRYVSTPDGAHHIILQGVQRFHVLDFTKERPFFVARVERLEEPETRTPEVEARFLHLKSQAIEALQLLPQAPRELLVTVQAVSAPGPLADLVAAYIDISAQEKQELLETIGLSARMDKVSRILAQRLEVLRLTHEIGNQTRAAFDKRQREAVLREQMATIQRELGEGESRAAEARELSEKLSKAGMPAEIEEQTRKEIVRYERMPEGSTEAGMVRTYLDWMLDLPWTLPDEQPIDIEKARRVLDADHFGLPKIKQRIIEYLAVRKLAPNGKAPILCFVGPPGVGKTSLGQSIARAMNRAFTRVSLRRARRSRN